MKINTIKKISFFDKIHCITLLTLILSSIFHRMELNLDSYTSSIFIPLEMLSTTLSMLYVFFIPLIFIFHFFKKNLLVWKLVLWIFSIFIIGIAMGIDAPTLLYMT